MALRCSWFVVVTVAACGSGGTGNATGSDAGATPDASSDAGTTPDVSSDAGTTHPGDASSDAGATPDASSDGPEGGTGSPIPASFFAMTIPASGADYPPVSIGALGHPSTLAWAFIERTKGSFTFTGFDKYVNDAKQHGLVDGNGAVQLTLNFGATPGWAASDPTSCQMTGNITTCTSPPTSVNDWADFVTAVVQHYNGTTAPHILNYELWNEANGRQFWTGTAQDLVNLAAAAYPIIHTDPYAKLLTPSVTGPLKATQGNGMAEWMTSYLQAGGAKYADGGTFHGYIAMSSTTPITPYPMPEQDTTSGCTTPDSCFGSILTKLTGIRAVLDQNGLKGKPLLDTEGSWGKDGNVTDPATQTAWLARWYILQASQYPAITQAAWFSWGVGGSGQQSWGGIEASPGVPTAAGNGYTQVYDWLVGSSFNGACAVDSTSTWTCPLTLSGGHAALIVWNTSGPTAFVPPSPYTQYRDLTGGTTPVNGSVPIEARPILLVK